MNISRIDLDFEDLGWKVTLVMRANGRVQVIARDNREGEKRFTFYRTGTDRWLDAEKIEHKLAILLDPGARWDLQFIINRLRVSDEPA